MAPLSSTLTGLPGIRNGLVQVTVMIHFAEISHAIVLCPDLKRSTKAF